jgi:hypothetical protein
MSKRVALGVNTCYDAMKQARNMVAGIAEIFWRKFSLKSSTVQGLSVQIFPLSGINFHYLVRQRFLDITCSKKIGTPRVVAYG